MHRYPAAISAILGLVGAAVLFGLMVASFWHFSFYTIHAGSLGMLWRSYGGVISFTGFPAAHWLPTFQEPLHWLWYLLGFGIESRAAAPASVTTLFIPHWILVILLLIHPVRWFGRTKIWLTRARQRSHEWSLAGLCTGCGYDLRAHQPGAKCPECGKPVPAKK